MNLFAPVSISEAHQRAVTLERQFLRRAPGPFTLPITHSSGSTSDGRPPQSTPTPPVRPTAARNSAPSSSFSGSAGSQPISSTRGPCFSCGEYGHRLANCPKHSTSHGLLIDDGSGDTYT